MSQPSNPLSMQKLIVCRRDFNKIALNKFHLRDHRRHSIQGGENLLRLK